MSSDLIDIKKIDINNPAEVNGAAEFIFAYDLFVEAYLLLKKLEGKESPPPSQRGSSFSPLSQRESSFSPLSQRGAGGDFSEAGVGNIGLTAVAREPHPHPLLKGEGVAQSASESMDNASGLYRREIPLTPFEKGGEFGKEIIPKLKWVALPKLKNEEIIKMFEENFTTIFELEGYDLWSKLKQKIVADIWYEERDGFKEKLRKALFKNEERITQNKIIINDKEHSPTVGNWLKDYNVHLGLAPVDMAKQSEYLTNSENMKKLVLSIKYKVLSSGEEGGDGDKFHPQSYDGAGISNFKFQKNIKYQISKFQNGEGREVEEGGGIGEKEKLKILFNFYEKLKISSLTAEGFEEGLYINEDGVEGVLDDGVFTKIDPREKERIRELQRIIDNVAIATRGNNADINADRTRKESSPLFQRGGRGDFSEARTGELENDGARDAGKMKSASKSMENTSGLYRRKISPSAFGSRPPANTAGMPLGKGVGDTAKRAYIFSLAEQELIKQNEEDIKRVARGNIILVGKELTKAVEEKNRPRTIAALRIAVKNNLLLGWSEKGGKTDEHRLETDKHGARMTRMQESVISENPSTIRENSFKAMEKYNYLVVKFLQLVLQEKLGLNENEAAKIGVHLYNLFRKLGRDIGYLAYYDEKDQKFYWMGE